MSQVQYTVDQLKNLIGYTIEGVAIVDEVPTLIVRENDTTSIRKLVLIAQDPEFNGPGWAYVESLKLDGLPKQADLPDQDFWDWQSKEWARSQMG